MQLLTQQFNLITAQILGTGPFAVVKKKKEIQEEHEIIHLENAF